jgi:hypothetical protein
MEKLGQNSTGILYRYCILSNNIKSIFLFPRLIIFFTIPAGLRSIWIQIWIHKKAEKTNLDSNNTNAEKETTDRKSPFLNFTAAYH